MGDDALCACGKDLFGKGGVDVDGDTDEDGGEVEQERGNNGESPCFAEGARDVVGEESAELFSREGFGTVDGAVGFGGELVEVVGDF